MCYVLDLEEWGLSELSLTLSLYVNTSPTDSTRCPTGPIKHKGTLQTHDLPCEHMKPIDGPCFYKTQGDFMWSQRSEITPLIRV